MLFNPVLALSLLSSLAGAASALQLVPRSSYTRLLPRQAGSECTQTCQNAYDIVQQCYSSATDVQAIAECSCGDDALSALEDCAQCAATSDLSEDEKSTIEDGVVDLVNQCDAAGLASTSLTGLSTSSMSGSASASASASGSGLLSGLNSFASASSGAAASSAAESESSASSAASDSTAAVSSSDDSQNAASDDADEDSGARQIATHLASALLVGAAVVVAAA